VRQAAATDFLAGKGGSVDKYTFHTSLLQEISTHRTRRAGSNDDNILRQTIIFLHTLACFVCKGTNKFCNSQILERLNLVECLSDENTNTDGTDETDKRRRAGVKASALFMLKRL
jgi:hypothetical protein